MAIWRLPWRWRCGGRRSRSHGRIRLGQIGNLPHGGFVGGFCFEEISGAEAEVGCDLVPVDAEFEERGPVGVEGALEGGGEGICGFDQFGVSAE